MNFQLLFQKKIITATILVLLVLTGCFNVNQGPKDIETRSTALVVSEDLPSKNIFGVQLETISSASGLQQMVQAKSVWTRRDYVWSTVEPTEGARNWDAVKYYEDELIAASQNGINLIMIILDAPSWARIDPNCGGKMKPEKLPALASFVRDLVARYSVPPYNLKYIEMWNEPDVDGVLGCWGNVNDRAYYGGSEYGDMLEVVYPYAKAANPAIQILVGGLLLDCDPDLGIKDCTSSYFLQGILESGAKNAFDGVAFHSGDYYLGQIGKYHNPNFAAAWNTTGPVTAAKASFLKNLLAQYGVTGKYLIDTEAGIKCVDVNKCPDPAYGFEETKAYYIVQDGATALAGYYRANIWYAVYGDRFSGLLTKDNQPLPAYYAFQFMTGKLENHTFYQNVTAYPGVKGFEFWSPLGKKLWVLWSLDGADHAVTLPAQPVSLDRITPAGTPEGLLVAADLSISIGVAPVFIQY